MRVVALVIALTGAAGLAAAGCGCSGRAVLGVELDAGRDAAAHDGPPVDHPATGEAGLPADAARPVDGASPDGGLVCEGGWIQAARPIVAAVLVNGVPSCMGDRKSVV